jgi:hypothetical protein
MTGTSKSPNKVEVSSTADDNSESVETRTMKGCRDVQDVEDLGYSNSYEKEEDDLSYCSTTIAANNSDRGSEDEEKLDLAKRETQAVLKLRLLVFDFLILATIAFGLGAYLWMSTAERREYNAQFEIAAQTVMDAFWGIATHNIPAMAGLALALEIQGGQQWPFVTVDRFQEFTKTYRDQAKALYLQVNPIVTLAEREQWETYVTGEHSFWV